VLKPGSWPCIVVLYLYGVVSTSIVSQAVPVISDIAARFQLSGTESGWVISIPSLVTALGALLGGWVIDRLGDKVVLFAGGLCGLAGNLLVVVARDTAALFLGRLVEGIGYLALAVGAVTLIMRTTEGRRRHLAMGLWASHTAVGIGLTFVIVAPLAGGGDRWRWAFVGQAVIMAVLAVAAWFLPARAADAPVRRMADILTVLRSAPPYRIALAAGTSAFIQTGIMNALTVYLTSTHGVSVAAAASVGTLGQVFVIVASVLVGYLRKAGITARTVALAGGAVALAGGLMIYLPTVPYAGVCVGVCAFSFGIGAVNALIWTFVPRAAPGVETMGATSGLVSSFTYAGVLLGPPVIFSTLHAGGGTGLRITLVVVAILVQLAPLPLGRGRAAGTAVRTG
jgi:MFS family permease